MKCQKASKTIRWSAISSSGTAQHGHISSSYGALLSCASKVETSNAALENEYGSGFGRARGAHGNDDCAMAAVEM